MSYEVGKIENYGTELGEFAFTGGVTLNVRGPKGCVGIVRDFLVDVTTSIIGTTSVPEIQVGISSGDTTYGRYKLGTTASNGFGTGAFRASQATSLVGNPPRTSGLFSGHIVLDGGTAASFAGRIAADAAFTIAVAAAVGSAAGKARIRVFIEWVGSNIGG